MNILAETIKKYYDDPSIREMSVIRPDNFTIDDSAMNLGKSLISRMDERRKNFGRPTDEKKNKDAIKKTVFNYLTYFKNLEGYPNKKIGNIRNWKIEDLRGDLISGVPVYMAIVSPKSDLYKRKWFIAFKEDDYFNPIYVEIITPHFSLNLVSLEEISNKFLDTKLRNRITEMTSKTFFDDVDPEQYKKDVGISIEDRLKAQRDMENMDVSDDMF